LVVEPTNIILEIVSEVSIWNHVRFQHLLKDGCGGGFLVLKREIDLSVTGDIPMIGAEHRDHAMISGKAHDIQNIISVDLTHNARQVF
jgi:hypothetical protein